MQELIGSAISAAVVATGTVVFLFLFLWLRRIAVAIFRR
jgi:hypothetical protein